VLNHARQRAISSKKRLLGCHQGFLFLEGSVPLFFAFPCRQSPAVSTVFPQFFYRLTTEMQTSIRLSCPVLFILLAAIIVCWPSALHAGGPGKSFPALEETARLAAERAKALKNDPGEAAFKASDLYYQIQYKSDQLKIAEEVRDHFTRAAEKAEEKFDRGDEGISQSSITKLKLGLSGAENDVLVLGNEIHFAKLSLGHLLGWEVTAETPLDETGIKAVEFAFHNLESYLASLNAPGAPPGCRACSGPLAPGKRLALNGAFIDVDQARLQMAMAKKSRKITRTLLVTEVANYDFGIGQSEDLFEALIIYTRVLRGYYETAYNLNRAVLLLHRQAICGGPQPVKDRTVGSPAN
jgi:hypothetical protein